MQAGDAYGGAPRAGLAAQHDGRRAGEPALVGLLAGRLYVLDQALAGHRERLLRSRSWSRPAVRGRSRRRWSTTEFAAILTEMYVQWADRRGMHRRAPRHAGRCASPSPISGPRLRRDPPAWKPVCTSSSTLARPRTAASRGQRSGAGRRQRHAPGAPGLSGSSTEASNVVVRRYRPGKSPLVRDSVRGYRTGRLDLVLAATSTCSS